MSEPKSPSAVVRRVLAVPPEVVFDEQIDPEALRQFVTPAPSYSGVIEVDPQVGGRFRIDMIDAGAVVRVTGEYLELDRPRRPRFTWTSSLGGGIDSVVTVSLEPHGEAGTMMTIDHAQLPPDWRADHERGWTAIARQLAERLTSEG